MAGTAKIDLSPEATATLEALLKHRTRKGAAKALGITYSALATRVRESPAILDAMAAHYRDNIRALQGRVQRGARKAAEFLEKILEDEDASDSNKLTAACKLLDMAVKLNESLDLDARTERLEEAAREHGILE